MVLIARRIHRWLGLAGILYLILMALTGILANHPTWFASVSVPAGWADMGEPYRNWNQSTLRDIVFSAEDPQKGFAYGCEGIWLTHDSGRTFVPFMDGLPESPPYRNIHALYFDENAQRMFAGSEAGLFVYEFHPKGGKWKRCPMESPQATVRSLFGFKEYIVAVTHSHLFLSSNAPPFNFQEIRLSPDTIPERPEKNVSDLILAIHTGAIFGLPGRLLIDCAGVILILLSISAFFLWYYPRHVKRKARTGKQNTQYRKSMYRLSRTLHASSGMQTASVMTLVASITACLVFLPLAPWQKILTVPVKYYSESLFDTSPWKGTVEKVLYNPDARKIIILTHNSLFEWDGNSEKAVRQTVVIPPSDMAEISVFRYIPEHKAYLIGTFSGLFRVNPVTGTMTSLKAEGRRITKVCGYLKAPNGHEYYCHSEKGLQMLAQTMGNRHSITMPEAIHTNRKVSLAKFCAELHSGRIYKPLLGRAWWIPSFLSSLVVICLFVTGTYIRCYRKH